MSQSGLPIYGIRHLSIQVANYIEDGYYSTHTLPCLSSYIYSHHVQWSQETTMIINGCGSTVVSDKIVQFCSVHFNLSKISNSCCWKFEITKGKLNPVTYFQLKLEVNVCEQVAMKYTSLSSLNLCAQCEKKINLIGKYGVPERNLHKKIQRKLAYLKITLLNANYHCKFY